MIQIDNPADCCGCTACASICVHKAISMQPDALGFLYPEVNKDKCINCGLCEKVCSFHNHYDKSLNLLQPKAFAVRHKIISEVESSRSGAAFIAISDGILEKGGIVYGVGYTDHFRVVHKRATTKTERNEFKGSKYVQSDLNTIFQQVKVDLQNGYTVLFSGTPCQTAGLNAYIGKKLREHLFLVDIICHGVPSPYIWKDYLLYLEQKYGGIITNLSFRDKQIFGWTNHKESFVIKGKHIYTNIFRDLFFKHIMIRQSCGVCHFANITRPSDITIGDFWGWEKNVPNFNKDDKGVSLVLLNTEKGEKLFEEIKDSMNCIPVKLEDSLQPNLQHPSPISPRRMAFEWDYKQKGFKYVLRKYGKDNLRQKIYKLVAKIIKNNLK